MKESALNCLQTFTEHPTQAEHIPKQDCFMRRAINTVYPEFAGKQRP